MKMLASNIKFGQTMTKLKPTTIDRGSKFKNNH